MQEAEREKKLKLSEVQKNKNGESDHIGSDSQKKQREKKEDLSHLIAKINQETIEVTK